MEINKKSFISALATSLRKYSVILSELSEAVHGVIMTHIKVFNLHLVLTGVNARCAERFVRPAAIADPLAILWHIFLTSPALEKRAHKPVKL